MTKTVSIKSTIINTSKIKLLNFGKPEPKGKIDMGRIHGKLITWSRRLTTEAAAKGRANLEQIYRSSGDVKWGRRLTTEAAEKGRRQRGEQI